MTKTRITIAVVDDEEPVRKAQMRLMRSADLNAETLRCAFSGEGAREQTRITPISSNENYQDHGSAYAKATADKLHGCYGWGHRVSPATPEPWRRRVILQTISSRSPQNISPGDPAAAGPLDSPQP